MNTAVPEEFYETKAEKAATRALIQHEITTRGLAPEGEIPYVLLPPQPEPRRRTAQPKETPENDNEAYEIEPGDVILGFQHDGINMSLGLNKERR